MNPHPHHGAHLALALALSTAALLTAPQAHAQEPQKPLARILGTSGSTEGFASPDEAQLRLYQEGAEAFRQGQYEKAVELFQASLHLGELNITWLNLGRALYKLGRCQEALEAYQSAMEAPRVQTPSPEQVAAKMQEYRADLSTTCPGYLILECSTQDKGPIMISIDGQPPVRCAADPILLPPGQHTVSSQMRGKLQERSIRIDPMQETRLAMLDPGQTPPVIEDKEQPAPKEGEALGLTLGLRLNAPLVTGGDYKTTGSFEGITFSGKDSYNSEPGLGGDLFVEYALLSVLAPGLHARYLTGLAPDFVDTSTELGARQFHELDLGAHLTLQLPQQQVFRYAVILGGGVAWQLPQDAAPEAMDSFVGYYAQASLEMRLNLRPLWLLGGVTYQYTSTSRSAQQGGVSLDEALTGTRILFDAGIAWSL